jgi:uncharacterized phosphosugar-binding protein
VHNIIEIIGQWQAAARAAMTAIDTMEREAIDAAAQLLADALARGGVVQTFGTGHSRSVALELVARAGGLAAANQLGIRDLAYYGDRPIATLLDPMLEREAGLAAQILTLADIRPEDAFIVVSNSGRNASVVEMATLARERGHPVVAITSRYGDGGSLPPLAAHADVLIDTHCPSGDAVLDTPGGRACGLSTLCGVYIAQSLLAATLDASLRSGFTPEILTSSNLRGGDDTNAPLRSRYAGRVRWGDA